MEQFETLLILMVVVWVAGKVFRMLNLPVLFGEVLGGILVGPMVFGLVEPNNETIILLAELGVFFLMLHAGLETNPKELLNSSKKSILISLGGIVVPFSLGFAVSKFSGLTTSESLIIGLILSITAIAITVRLFKDYRLQRTQLAHTTIAAAVFNDIIALILFSIIFTLIETGEVSFFPIAILVAKILAFFGVIIIGGLKISKHMQKFLNHKGFTFALIVALVLGIVAESIGLHAIIGAFLAGLFIREEILDERTFNKIEDRIYGLSYSFLGPIFFTSLAFNLDFKAMFAMPTLLLSLLGVTIFGKVFGAGIMAYVQKIKAKEALTIGIAMNSKGVIDLVIASIALKSGIISNEIFSMIVVIAFACTLFALFAIKPLIKSHP